MYRTHTCGALRNEHIGTKVTLSGWVQRSRDLGGMTFIDLRDRYGITQLVFNMETDAELCEKARKLGREFVIQIEGAVIERSSKNKNMPTGDIEIEVSKLSILNDHMKSWVFETKHKIYKLVDKYGKLRAKAFPGRAAILIKLLGLTEDHISAVYEIKGSIKVGHYVPGTRIPILPESELYKLGNQDETILNLAWHIPNEVRKNLKSNISSTTIKKNNIS